MSEACLRCRDPRIYCKLRSSCTIHFLTRRAAGLEEGAERKETRPEGSIDAVGYFSVRTDSRRPAEKSRAILSAIAPKALVTAASG